MKGKAKRILCLTMAVVMLLLSPVSNAMSNINEVHATGLEAYYGAQFFEMILATYGVSQLGTDKDELYQDFGSYLNSIEKPDIWTIFQGLTNNNPKVRVTKDILSSVYGFLIKKFGSLTSGKHNTISAGTVTQVGTFNNVQKSIVSYFNSQSGYNADGYYFYYLLPNTSSNVVFSPYGIYALSNYSVHAKPDLYQYVFVIFSDGLYRVLYTSDGIYGGEYSSQSGRVASYSEKSDTYSIGGKTSNSYGTSGMTGYITNIPLIVRSDLKAYDACYTNKMSLADLKSGSTSSSKNIYSSASWGKYNEKTIDAITDKDVDISAIIATVGAAGSAVKDNTTTNADTGEDEYSDKIADAVASAVAKALTDAGVIAGTDTGTDTDDKDDTEVPAGLMGILVEILSAIKAIPQFFTDNILDAVYAIRDAVKPLGGYIADARDKVVAGIESIPAYIESTSDKIADVIEGAQAVLAGIFSNVLDEVKAIPKSIADIFTDVIEGAKTGWLTLWDWLKKILDAILSLPASIAELIEAILTKVFVPDLAKAQDQILVIQNKFGWVTALNDCIKSNLTSLKPDSAPPVIYIDFTQAESSKYVPVGKQVAIDFSWYARYKPTGDAVIGSFMWIVYLWYLWKRLPDIISGSGMLTMSSMRFENNMANKNTKTEKGKE